MPFELPFLRKISHLLIILTFFSIRLDLALPFRFTGNIDSLKYKLGPEQLSPDEKKTAMDAAEKAKD
jgi:hypothetical protein